MAPLFSKRLSCFYCGRRSAQPDKGPVRKWRCNHCEAINYLDEVGFFLSISFMVDTVLTLLCDYRKEKSQTLRQQRRILTCTAQEQQAPLSSRPNFQDPACSVRNVFAINICSQVRSHLTSHPPTTPTTLPMKGNTRSSGRTWRNGIPRFAPDVSLA